MLYKLPEIQGRSLDFIPEQKLYDFYSPRE